MSIQKGEKFICKISSLGMQFIIWVILLSAFIGSIFSFLNIKWGIIPIFCILSASLIFIFFLRDIDVFSIDSRSEWILLVITTIVSTIIYKDYAASISIQQDQSIYIMKALNLVNHGYTYKPMITFNILQSNGIIDTLNNLENYGVLENGNTLVGDKLYTDFYAGGAYFYAMLGMIKRHYTFYGQTLVTIANTWLMYFSLKKILSVKYKITPALFTIAFFVSPISVWFGRSSSTETVALLIFLSIFLLLLSENLPSDYWLIIPFTVALVGRIDYFLVSLLGIFILTYRNKKVGAITMVASSIFAFICTKVFWIYYDRIKIRDMKLVKYQIPLFISIFLITLVLCKVKKDMLEDIYNTKLVKYITIIWGFVITLMMFRDTFTREENWGRFTEFGLNIRSFEECIMDNLFLVFPSFIFVLGLLGAYKIYKYKNINIFAAIYLLGLVVVYSYFVYHSGNAPQMYFLLRRYYNIFIPGILILFTISIHDLNEKNKILIAFCTCILSLNLLGNSNQQIEYAKLEESTRHFVYTYNEEKVSTIFYNHNDKYDISPIVSYGNYDVVPLQDMNELKNVCNNTDFYNVQNSIYLSTEPIIGVDNFKTINMNYYRMGENYEELPKEYYYIEVKLYVYNMNDLINIESLGSVIY